MISEIAHKNVTWALRIAPISDGQALPVEGVRFNLNLPNCMVLFKPQAMIKNTLYWVLALSHLAILTIT